MSVKVSDLSFGYGERQVLRGVSFEAPSGALVSILGKNGAGKSTLFRCMLGLLRGFGGSVTIDGEDIRALSAGQLSRRIAYIPQLNYPAFSYSVLDMVLMGTSGGRMFSMPGKKEERAALEALARLGMEEFAHRDYFRLSGGERQLVLIARALAQQSRILVLDEPTSALDYGNQMLVMSRLKALAQSGYTVIQSTHNPEQAYLFSDMLLAIKDGRIVASGRPQDVLHAALIEEIYGIEAGVISLADDAVRVCVPKEMNH